MQKYRIHIALAFIVLTIIDLVLLAQWRNMETWPSHISALDGAVISIEPIGAYPEHALLTYVLLVATFVFGLVVFKAWKPKDKLCESDSRSI